MYESFRDNDELDFGGQTQIVNTQEQNREVNPGGITQTDSEKNLYGPEEEKTEPVTGKLPAQPAKAVTDVKADPEGVDMEGEEDAETLE